MNVFLILKTKNVSRFLAKVFVYADIIFNYQPLPIINTP